MDDFGSGYSSLNMLKEMDIDTLKIDMQFMEELATSRRAGNILISIVRMAKTAEYQYGSRRRGNKRADGVSQKCRL